MPSLAEHLGIELGLGTMVLASIAAFLPLGAAAAWLASRYAMAALNALRLSERYHLELPFLSIPPLVFDPSGTLILIHMGVQQHRHHVGLGGEIDERLHPPHHRPRHAGQADRYRQGERQNRTDAPSMPKQQPALGQRVPDHGGHIPS